MHFIRANSTLVATAGLVGVGSAYALWKWYSKDVPPANWKYVGTLSDLMCFPIKSCGVIRMPSMECTEMGVQINQLRDRDFVVINETGNFQSARVYPSLVLINLSLNGNIFTLNAPNMEPFDIDLSKLSNMPKTTITLWEKAFKSVDCGDAVAKWISRFILNQDSGLRLAHYPDKRNSMKRSRIRELVNDTDSGAYPDLTSYNLMNESSVEDLNTRLSNLKVDSQNFRPNFVVKGPLPYEEDNWNWVQIGDVVFKVVKYCTRCVLTTVDYKTGVKNENGEPLATLKKYRMIGTKKYDKGSPVLGIHLVLYKPGTVKVGDQILIG